MNEKSLKKILIIAGVILGIALIITLIASLSNRNNNPTTLLTYNKNDINKITLTAPSQTLTFEKQNNAWQVNSFTADSTEMDTILTDLTSSNIVNIASKNKDSEADFNIDDNNAIKIIVTAGSKSTIFLLGKTAGTSDSYIRFNGEDIVYEINQGLSSIFGNTINYFRDKTVSNIDSTKVTTLQINNLKLSKDSNNNWIDTDDPTKSLDQSKVSDLITSASALKGTDIPTDTDKANIKTLVTTVTIGYGTQTYTYTIYQLNTIYYGKPQGQDIFYTLDGSEYDNINKVESDLVAS